MTAEPALRLKIMKKALDNNVQLVFVDENILLDSQEALNFIERIFEYAYLTKGN
jgi:hypothetical protein